MSARRNGWWVGAAALLRGLPAVGPTLAIVALLACVLVPLPAVLVDLLLSLSLSVAVLLLVASLRIGRTSEFLGFPSLLLLVTLYRLALNISTTRLILTEAYAGEVIESFASFVVRDDLIVGGVVFLIITVVQYVVIARGAERVAEVSARFALDALPGHQTAIDADLRAGVITAREAAERRARLIERSSFYGAMDGAVRYVKGDAIAGLAITALNLFGGIAIGTMRLGYGWQESVAVFGRLTIGDGLLSQIPALLVSLAAGVLVSRVDRESRRPLGALPWLQPAMLLVPAVLLIVLAWIPAMPSLAFATTAVALVTVAMTLAARRAKSSEPMRVDRGPVLLVRVSARDVDDPRSFARDLEQLRARCRDALGIEMPPWRLQIESTRAVGSVRLELSERVLGSANGLIGEEAVLIEIYRMVMDQAAALVDIEDIDRMVEQTRGFRPAVVQEAMAAVTLPDLLRVVRNLLDERLTVPPTDALLGVLAEDRRFRIESERPRWPAIVRTRLSPYWLPPLLDATERLGAPTWVRLDPELEAELVARVPESDAVMIDMAAAERGELLRRIRELAVEGAIAGAETSTGEHPPILVVATPRARPVLARILAGARPHVAVLGTDELECAGVVPPTYRWLQAA